MFSTAPRGGAVRGQERRGLRAVPRERAAARPGGDALPRPRLHRARWRAPPRHDHARSTTSPRAAPPPATPTRRGRTCSGCSTSRSTSAPADRLIAAARRRVVVTIAIEVALISAFLVAFISFFVTRPIHRLMEANVALGRMDLEHPIEITSSRELWSLAELLQPHAGPPARGPGRDQPGGAGARGQGGGAHRAAPAGAAGACSRPTASPRSASSRPASPTRSTTRSPASSTSPRSWAASSRTTGSRGSASPSSAATSTGSPSRPRGRGASCPTSSPSRAARSPSGPRPTSTPSCARRSASSRTS